jgi:PAB-dependent poly(A)-specific ribonuclease subunit 3
MHFGQLIVTLACGSVTAVHDTSRAMDHISKQYSSDLLEIVTYLMVNSNTTKSIDFVASLLAPRLLQQLDASFSHCDGIEYELSKELENGRLARLLCKLGFINERPE